MLLKGSGRVVENIFRRCFVIFFLMAFKNCSNAPQSNLDDGDFLGILQCFFCSVQWILLVGIGPGLRRDDPASLKVSQISDPLSPPMYPYII